MRLRILRTMSSSSDRVRDFLDQTFSRPDMGVLASESVSQNFVDFYNALSYEEKGSFLCMLCRGFGVNQNNVVQVAQNVISAQERGEAVLLKAEERLRTALTPRYHQLFCKIGRIQGGVKFLVDLRADALVHISSISSETDAAGLRSLSNVLRELLALWFSVGFLQLERITWNSPCHMVQKISEYEAVHPIRNLSDMKRRVGPYRRCFVFTHNSMPGEPIVVLHTALTNEISSSIHAILQTPGFSSQNRLRQASEPESPLPLDDPLLDGKENPDFISTAMFYSITSTQKGLQGVDLGNYLIKSVVRELQQEFPGIHKFSSVSPIPGFRDWLVTEVNQHLHALGAGEEVPGVELLQGGEAEELRRLGSGGQQPLALLKSLLHTNAWAGDADTVNTLHPILMRLCARYLYLEKRRNYALNPVANFHLGNGAVLWRINWLADTSVRGLSQSCGMMVNYRYVLESTELNSQRYLETFHIEASEQVRALATGSPSP